MQGALEALPFDVVGILLERLLLHGPTKIIMERRLHSVIRQRTTCRFLRDCIDRYMHERILPDAVDRLFALSSCKLQRTPSTSVMYYCIRRSILRKSTTPCIPYIDPSPGLCCARTQKNTQCSWRAQDNPCRYCSMHYNKLVSKYRSNYFAD